MDASGLPLLHGRRGAAHRVCSQICLSYLVYRAVRYHRRGFFLAAMGIHFAVDALGALLKDAVPVPVLEAILAAIVIVTAIFTVRLYRGETEEAVSD